MHSAILDVSPLSDIDAQLLLLGINKTQNRANIRQGRFDIHLNSSEHFSAAGSDPT